MTMFKMITVGLLALCSPPTSGGIVNVSFENPRTFTDASDRGVRGSEASASVMRGIRTSFEEEGRKYLDDREVIDIEVHDIDLAGRIEPLITSDGRDLRILREGSWPRIYFRYTLRRGDEVVRSADVRIVDVNYLSVARLPRSTEALSHDKRMIADWFRAEFGEMRTGAVER